MPSVHALLSASASERWLNCTPSARLEAALPDRSTSYSEEGTKAHTLAEKKLNSWIKHGRRLRFKASDGEMNEATDGYRDYVIEILNEERKNTPDAELLVEQRLDFSRWVPEGFGTGDAIIIGDDTLHVIDLKYGKGVKVEAEGNTQLKLYAAGAFERFGILYDFAKIRVHIYQPRLDHISTAEYAVDELLAWMDEVVRPAAARAYEGAGEQQTGAWCRFCKARSTCPVRAGTSMRDVQAGGFPGRELSDEAIGQLLPKLDDIAAWVKDLQQLALDKAIAGTRFPGFKLVEGRSNRKIMDEPGLITALHNLNYGDDLIMTKPKLETITNLEKVIGKKMFTAIANPYIDKPQGKPTLVPVTDRRPELNLAAQEFADDLKEEDTHEHTH